MDLIKSAEGKEKSIPTKGIVIITLLCVALAGSIAFHLYSEATRDKKVVTTDSIREEIVPVAKLTTFEYNFTQIMYLSDSNNILNIDNPITTKRYVATIDGTVPIQIDAEQISCEVEANDDGTLKKVSVTMPHSTVGDVYLDHDTLKKYVEENGIFNFFQVSTDDLNALYAQAEKDQTVKAEESGILEKSDERAEGLIENQIKSLHGEDIEVEFEFIEG